MCVDALSTEVEIRTVSSDTRKTPDKHGGLRDTATHTVVGGRVDRGAVVGIDVLSTRERNRFQACSLNEDSASGNRRTLQPPQCRDRVSSLGGLCGIRTT